jgi:hypothetical protein
VLCLCPLFCLPAYKGSIWLYHLSQMLYSPSDIDFSGLNTDIRHHTKDYIWIHWAGPTEDYMEQEKSPGFSCPSKGPCTPLLGTFRVLRVISPYFSMCLQIIHFHDFLGEAINHGFIRSLLHGWFYSLNFGESL